MTLVEEGEEEQPLITKRGVGRVEKVVVCRPSVDLDGREGGDLDLRRQGRLEGVSE
jgi:hypothetical protein